MRAIAYLAPGKIELQEIPIPRPAAGELLVQVRAALTCGTDVKTYRRGHPKFPPPFVFGHEFAGDIVALGEGVTGFRPGQRVTANVFAECGECYYCQRGQGNLCDHLVYNFGAFAEYTTIPASIVRLNTFEIPAHTGYAEAAILEPLVTVVHGQDRLAIQPGESLAIIGAGGPISLLHLQLARLRGVGQVIAVGHSDTRLQAFRGLGADLVINAHTSDPLDAIRQATGGRGADTVIECGGSKAAWETAVLAARKGGRVLWFGGLPAGTQIELDGNRIHYGEITLLGIHGGSAQDARRAFELIISGRLDVRPLLSAEFPLEGVETALQEMSAGNLIKAVIYP